MLFGSYRSRAIQRRYYNWLRPVYDFLPDKKNTTLDLPYVGFIFITSYPGLYTIPGFFISFSLCISLHYVNFNYLCTCIL